METRVSSQLSELPLGQANALAKAVQHNVPFVSRPFVALGAPLALDEAQVIAQLATWKAEHKLRELSAILEGSALGYDSALVAGRVPAEDLERVAEVVSAHPTVTHNYLRDHDYNLWFTIAVPREVGLERTLDALAREAVVPGFFALRRTHTFKVGVNFDLVSRRSDTAVVALTAPAPVSLTPQDISLFRALQTPLPIVPRPFMELAHRFGVAEDELLAFGRRHLGGAMRRYVGTFHHRRLGVSGNGMVVWKAPADELERLGAELAGAPEVSHCYARNAIPGFDNTLYSMLHGPDETAVREVAARVATRLGLRDYLILFSSREFKKCRLRYFLPELEDWSTARLD